MLMKIVVAAQESVEEAGEARRVDIGARAELVSPFVERGGIICPECPVRTKRRKDTRGELGRGNLFVILQQVRRIVCGANRRHAEFGQDSLGRQLLRQKAFIGQLPNLWSGALIEELIQAEVP